MSTPAPPSAPAPPIAWFREFGRPPRIMGLDVARGLAVLGMIGAHLGAPETFRLLDPETWGAIVHGRSSILFAVLAGVSVAILTGRTEIPPPERRPRLRLSLVGRGAAIFAAGIVLELLHTDVAIILTVYGVLYIAALPFLGWSPARLLLGAGLFAVLGPPLLAALYALSLGASGPGLDLAVFGAYPLTVWMAFLLAGMALGRMRLERPAVAVGCLGIGSLLAAIGYGLGGAAAQTIADRTAVTAPHPLAPDVWSPDPPYGELLAAQLPLQSIAESFFLVEPHTGGTAEILGSGGLAVALIGLCLLISRPLRWPLLPLAALGSMPLTAYSAHIVTLALVIDPLGGADPLGGLREAAWGWSAIVLLLCTTIWAATLGRGPLERLVARVARAAAGPGRPPEG